MRIYSLSVLFLFVLGASVGCVMTPEQGEQLAQDIRAVEGAILDALPLPIPKDPLKEVIGSLSDYLILGGAAGGGGLLIRKKMNGRKKA